MLLPNLFIALMRLISVEHNLLSLFLIPHISLGLFGINQLEIRFYDLRLMFHLLMLSHLPFQFSLLIAINFREVTPHFLYTLFLLSDTLLVLLASHLELLILQ